MSPSKVSQIKWDEFSNVVDGKTRGSKEKHQGTNPATGQKLWEVPIANQQDVDDAVVSAQKAQEKWSQVPFEKRVEAIRKFKDHYLSYADDMITLLKQETGKPVRNRSSQIALRLIADYCMLSTNSLNSRSRVLECSLTTI